MRVIVLARTLNEEQNIARFCRCYAQADKILVADGGSTDRTVELAGQFENVEIRHFRERTQYPGSVIFNPETHHINFLIDWAVREQSPDWLVNDDVDCVPTAALHGDMFSLLAACSVPVVCAYRLYVWGSQFYLPKMSLYGQSLWAWRPGDQSDIRGDESLPEIEYGFTGVPSRDSPKRVDLAAPFCLLHYFAPSEAEYARKARRYAARGTPYKPIRETEYWPPEPLPTWAVPPEIKVEHGEPIIRLEGTP